MGDTLMENRNGLIVLATLSQADDRAKRVAAKAMIGKARQANPQAAITRAQTRDAQAEGGSKDLISPDNSQAPACHSHARLLIRSP